MEENIEMIDVEYFGNPQQALEYVDSDGLNYLLRAAEKGRTEEVVNLLGIGFDANSSYGEHTAANLAYENKHFDTVLVLLRENSKFPCNFDVQKIDHNALIEFNRLMNDFHDCVTSKNLEALEIITNANSNLRYFYKSGGKSAAYEALNNMILSSYEFLVSKNILLSPDEDFSEVIMSYTDEQKEDLRKIHEKYAVAMPNNHLMIFHASLFVGHDIPLAERDHRLESAKNSINFLNSIPQIQLIMKLVANAGGFKIIFDFNRENTQFINPTSDNSTRGIFCTTRHIYIAAKNLFDEEKKFQVYGTIAHELCHFAMGLIYHNSCKPFTKEEESISREFGLILHECHQLKHFDKIIDLVFDYSSNRHVAELIVRVPHMIAYYANDQETLNLRREHFNSLFNFFENRVLVDVEEKIPKIHSEVNQVRVQYLDKTHSKVSKWRKIARISSILLTVSITIITALLFYYYCLLLSQDNKLINSSNVSAELKVKLMNANVKFLDFDFKFSELYSTNGIQMNSSQFDALIDGKSLDLSDSSNKYLEEQINLVYSNLSEKLKPKLFNACVNFQGRSIRIHKIVDHDDEIYDVLNSSQIFAMLKNKTCLTISEDIKSDVEIFIERTYFNKIDEVNSSKAELIEMNEKSKLILLSDVASTGKSTVFKRFGMTLLEKYPDKWISFIRIRKKTENLKNPR